MRYTNDEDRVARATLWIPIRLTREHIAAAKQMAKKLSGTDASWRGCLASIAVLAIENELDIHIQEGLT